MHWLCLYFHELPLEACFPGSLNLMCAVLDGARVVAANGPAQAAGIHPGLTLESAVALAPAVRLRQRNPGEERRQMQLRAGRALQFTALVSCSHEQALLLEIQGSERLFGGRARLLQEVRRAFLDARCHMACAPTPLGALCLARGGGADDASQDFRQQFSALPLPALPITEATLLRLQELGLQSVGDCLRLPRQGLRLRFRDLMDLLDRALGQVADPQSPYVPPLRFDERLDLPSPLATLPDLTSALGILLRRLETMLSDHAAAMEVMELHLAHEHRTPTVLSLRLIQPQSRCRDLVSLWREQLGAHRLPEAVHALRLVAPSLSTRTLEGATLFAGFREEKGDTRWIDRLRARLARRVWGLGQVADHRPEHAWRYREIDTPGVAVSGAEGRRPLWLLPAPERLTVTGGQVSYRGVSLQVQQWPERIEGGWWTRSQVHRDYFVADSRDGRRLWIFCDRISGFWFLHGVFS